MRRATRATLVGGDYSPEGVSDVFGGIGLHEHRMVAPFVGKALAAVAGGESDLDALRLEREGDGKDGFASKVDVEDGDIDIACRLHQLLCLREAHGWSDDDASELGEDVLEIEEDEAFVFD